MTEPTHERVRALFDRALELPRAERAALLARECAADETLRLRVEALLAAGDDGRFLVTPTAAGTTAPLTAQESPGARIGPYRLVQQVGEGGFGVVFLAQQEQPVTRRVALKIIKLGMDTRQVVARFEVERQALALMDHPHIARVIDAGSTEAGRPYFVMEYVPGQPITNFCDTENLTIEARLELFQQVCDAVQHAHSKGIIHRDLKPSNILVAMTDGRPQAKIIDFGIAKATQQKLTDKTLFTEHQQVIGTLQYMSPEQAGGSLDIDTRTDVYALGVVLYELLTGSTPFDATTLRDAFLSEIQRMIREVDPPKPSTRLNESNDTLASVAARRRVEPKRLGGLVRGELDWIVMKALEKDRGRRYESAHGLGQDLRRYLGGEAVVAAPPSALYRLRKFSRRNRTVVLTGSAVAAALVVGVVAFAWQANIAREERDKALAAQAAEVRQRQLADEQRAEALRQQALAEDHAAAETKARSRAEATTKFVTEALQSADPNQGGSQEISVLEAMDQAAKLLGEGAFAGEPDIEASLLSVIADILYRNGRTAGALPLAEKSLELYTGISNGPSADVAKTTNLVATIQQDLGHFDVAEPLFERSLALNEALHPGDHSDVAMALNNLALVRAYLGRPKDCVPLMQRALEMQRRLTPGDDPEVAMNMNNLAGLLDQLGRREEALPLYERSSAMYGRLYDSHPQLAMSLFNLGQTYIREGRLPDARDLLERALAMYQSLFQGDHPDVARALSGVGNIFRVLGRFEEAEAQQIAAVEMRQRLFPGDHPSVAEGLQALALARREAGKLAEAEATGRELLAMRRRLAPAGHPDTARALDMMGGILRDQDRYAEAEAFYVEAVELQTRLRGADHADTAGAKMRCALLLRDLERYDDAIRMCTEAVATMRNARPGDHPAVAAAIASLGIIELDARHDAEGERHLAEALAMERRVYPGGHFDTAQVLVRHARALDKIGRKDEARAEFTEAVAMHRRRTPDGGAELIVALHDAGASLLANDAPEAALPLLEEAVSMSERLLASTSPKLAQNRAKLAECRAKLAR
jgi:serine/threonine protein kinase